MDEKLKWLTWIKELQATAQVGHAYCKDEFCVARYERIGQIAAEIAADHSKESFTRLIHIFGNEISYSTPKLDGRAVVFKDEKLLMVCEADDGLWSLPGGWMDVNDSASESVEREVMEESGYLVKATKLLAFYDKHKHDHPPQWPHAYKCFFLCELKGGEPKLSMETTDIGFFEEDKLPELSVDRITEKQIHRMFEHYRHPDWPTDFD